MQRHIDKNKTKYRVPGLPMLKPGKWFSLGWLDQASYVVMVLISIVVNWLLIQEQHRMLT